MKTYCTRLEGIHSVGQRMIHPFWHVLEHKCNLANVELLAGTRWGSRIFALGAQAVTYLSCKCIHQLTQYHCLLGGGGG